MRLSDILSNGGDGDDINRLWKETEAAGEFGPIPAGEYVAHIIEGELEKSRTKATPGYKLTFKVVEGDFSGRHFWLDCWLTPAAMPQTKRDLSKLGMTSLNDCEKPLPRFIRCKCKVVVRKDDDGTERNRVKSFEVIGFDKEDDDPFAPGAFVAGPSEPLPTLPGIAMTQPTNKGGECVPF